MKTLRTLLLLLIACHWTIQSHAQANTIKVTRPHSYSKNVQILDSAFYMPEMNKKRRIWVYLPEGYQTSRNRYPVLYMHDGQNLFDIKTSAFGEWGVDECLDSLIQKGAAPMIVIGIDHGGNDRLKEYNPYDSQFGKAEGKMYTEFIVKTLKPYVDKTFRTKTSRQYTAIAGSSMGGLISMYAIARYPNIFGTAGIFSPAFWVAPDIYPDVLKMLPSPKNNRIYFVAGALEDKSMLPNMEKMYKQLNPKDLRKNIRLIERQDGKHSEWFWHREFPDFYGFITKGMK